MDKFRELTSRIKFNEPYDIDGHKAIYDHLVDLLPRSRKKSTGKRNASSDVTPTCLVFYAARNILFPSFIVGQIPDLLNFLAAIEAFRQFAVIKSNEALEWEKYYEREQKRGRALDVRLLTPKEVCTLQRFLDLKDAQRSEYITLVGNLIQFYIHYFWVAPESCLLGLRLNDFFPRSIQGVDEESKLLFHVGLSEDERKSFEQFHADCSRWQRMVLDWQMKREETCRTFGLSEEDMQAGFADDFLHAFPLLCNLSEMAHDVQIYINKVEDMVGTLEEWFPPST